MPDLHANQSASILEAYNAINGLSDTDHVKLMIIARSLAKKRTGRSIVSAEDLLQEAITKTLAGDRKWNRTVSIVQHLVGVMRSDSSHVAEQTRTRREESLINADEHVGQALNPEFLLCLADEYQAFTSSFEGDTLVQNILHLKYRGHEASDIIHELGISKTQYDTALKRIRRRLIKNANEEPVRT